MAFKVLRYHNLSVLVLLLSTANFVMGQTVSCEICCPNLFSSSMGIINVTDKSSLFHSISYLLRCLLTAEEVVIVSDGVSSRPTWANWERHTRDDRKKRLCTYAENVAISHIKATDFLQSEPGYFHQLVHTFDPSKPALYGVLHAKRINFIFAPESHEEMSSLVTKVEEELQALRYGRKFFWQPYVLFIWPEIQQVLRNIDSNGIYTSILPGKIILDSWFGLYQPYFTLDSGIFFFFIVQKGNSTRSRTNLYLSMWETYKLKGKFIAQEITDLSSSKVKNKEGIHQKPCNGTMRDKNSIISWMEKANSYVFLERFMRRDNFRQLPVMASIVESEDTSEWISTKRNENGTLMLDSGASVGIFRALKQMMNFSEEVLVGDRVQYFVSRNDSLSTIYLNMEKADILLNQKSISPARGQIYTFLQPTYYGIYQAFFRQPSSTIRNIVSAPFTLSLWLIIIATWAVIIGCLYGWGFLARRYDLCTRNDNEFIDGIFMWAVAAISQKSWYISPSSTNFKTFFYIGSLMALVCYVAYSAVIVSFLTVKIIPIQSLKDLIEYNYKFTVHESSENTMTLVEALINLYGLRQDVIKVSTENEVTHLFHQSRAFLSYPDLFYKTAEKQNYTETFICSTVYSFPAGNMPYQSSMAVRKGSQFRETFSVKLLIVIERGLNFRYRKTYEDSKGINCPKKNLEQGRTVVDPVVFTDVFTTFLVIFVGWLLALWVFLTERLYHRRKIMSHLLYAFN